jgi:hypothetical protein
MEVASSQLGFPQVFCCNCGVTDITIETQDTRVTRFFGLGSDEMTFKLSVPVCTGCRKTIRRRPAGFYSRIGLLAASFLVVYLTLLVLSLLVVLPPSILDNVLAISVVVALVFTAVFYVLRRPKPPQTTFYQAVRIKSVRLQVTGLMAGEGQVGFMKFAFTNPDYLNMFVNANEDAIKAKRVAVVKA